MDPVLLQPRPGPRQEQGRQRHQHQPLRELPRARLAEEAAAGAPEDERPQPLQEQRCGPGRERTGRLPLRQLQQFQLIHQKSGGPRTRRRCRGGVLVGAPPVGLRRRGGARPPGLDQRGERRGPAEPDGPGEEEAGGHQRIVPHGALPCTEPEGAGPGVPPADGRGRSPAKQPVELALSKSRSDA